ncbi:MAG: hypothetical protein HC906_03840 [Bacteroidales bacterium]|nr:hypothetical protein [Bacteroidales bacterium]
MNIYIQKIRWKFFLFIMAVFIGFGSLWYTSVLVKNLSDEERKKVELWAEALVEVINTESNEHLNFHFRVIENNETIPVILIGTNGEIITSRNFKSEDTIYLKKKIRKVKTGE